MVTTEKELGEKRGILSTARANKLGKTKDADADADADDEDQEDEEDGDGGG